MADKTYPSCFTFVNDEPENACAYGAAPLQRFRTSDTEITGIRNAKAYDKESLADMKASINDNGKSRIENPPHVYLMLHCS